MSAVKQLDLVEKVPGPVERLAFVPKNVLIAEVARRLDANSLSVSYQIKQAVVQRLTDLLPE
jgi:hypothetical protein